MSELLVFIVKNKNLITFFITCFTALMLVWSNYESKKSRELQYMPFLRLTSKSYTLEFSKPYKDDEETDINSKQVYSQYFSKNNKTSKNILKIINDGVGFAKDIKFIIDYTRIIDILEKHQNTNDLYYLKPLFDLYEVKSFHYPMYEGFNLKIRFWTRIYNEILKLKSNTINKLKEQSVTDVKIGNPLIYRKYSTDIIKQNNYFKIDIGRTLDLIGLMYLINTNDNNRKIKLPIILEYSTIENKKRKQYHELNVFFSFERNMMKMTDKQLNEIINSDERKQDICKKKYHNIKISYQFKNFNSLIKKFKIIKYKIRSLV